MEGPGSNSYQYPVSQRSHYDQSGMEVYNGHHTAPIPHYKPSSPSYTESQANQHYSTAPEAVLHEKPATPEKRVCGLRLSVLLIIVSGLLLLVIAALGLIAGLLGSKIASLEQAVPTLPNNVVTTPESSNSNTNNNDNNIPTTTLPIPSPGSTLAGTTPAQAITTHIIVPNYKYIGCYIDDMDRILKDSGTANTKITNQACADFCGDDVKYFGTESGQQCYCGKQIAERAMKANEWNCNMQCDGRRGKLQEICGGNWFLGIWERTGSTGGGS